MSTYYSRLALQDLHMMATVNGNAAARAEYVRRTGRAPKPFTPSDQLKAMKAAMPAEMVAFFAQHPHA